MDTNPAEYGYATRHGYGDHEDPHARTQLEPVDVAPARSAIIRVGDRLEFESNYTDNYFDVVDDGRLRYRIHFEHGSPVTAIDFFGGREQSGSGHQPADHDLRPPAGRVADDPDPRGTTAGVPAGVGEPGAMWPAEPDAYDDANHHEHIVTADGPDRWLVFAHSHPSVNRCHTHAGYGAAHGYRDD